MTALIDLALAGQRLTPRQFREFAGTARNFEQLEVQHGTLTALQRDMQHTIKRLAGAGDAAQDVRDAAKLVDAAMKRFQLHAHNVAVYDAERPPAWSVGTPV